MRGALPAILLVLLVAAAPAGAAPLRLVGEGPAPARAFDERFAVVARTPDVIAIWSDLGPTRSHDLPAGCEPRDLRFPRLVLACDEEGRAERPVVLDVVSGARTAPPLPPPSPTEVDTYRVAGRHWIAGMRTDPRSGGAIAVVLNRSTGELLEVSGRVDLDSPQPRLVVPEPAAPARCGPKLQRGPGGVFVGDFNCRRPRKVAGPGAYALTWSTRLGAFVERGRLRVVSLATTREVGWWPLPAGPRAGMQIALTRRHVFASIPAGSAWRTYVGDV
jgi:hypothetical protein